MATTDLVPTDDTAEEVELRELFSMERDDPPLDLRVETHDGVWIYDSSIGAAGAWRFWKVSEDD